MDNYLVFEDLLNILKFNKGFMKSDIGSLKFRKKETRWSSEWN